MSHQTRHQQLAEQKVNRKSVFQILAHAKAGVHAKSNKAKRQAAKHQWKKEAAF